MALPRALSWPLALLLCAVPLAGCAGECSPVVEGGWIRKPPADLPMLAAYARIANPCDRPVVVVSAASDAFAEVTVHATVVENGISRMRPVREWPIAAGATAVMQPGGIHLMLMQPRRALRDGDRVGIRFTLADGRAVDGQFRVMGPKAMP